MEEDAGGTGGRHVDMMYRFRLLFYEKGLSDGIKYASPL